MNKMANKVVAEYDYYTLDQARKIILAEEKQRKKKIIENYVAIATMFATPFLMFFHWIIVGY